MNLSKAKKIKLARMLSFVKELSTDKGLIVIDGETEIGNEVFIYDDNGEAAPAPDGEYTTNDVVIVIEGGKITEVKEVKKEDEIIIPVEDAPIVEDVIEEMEEETNEELHVRIAELESDVAQRDEQIKQLTEELKKYKEKEETPVADPAEEATPVQMSNVERRQKNALGIVSFLKK